MRVIYLLKIFQNCAPNGMGRYNILILLIRTHSCAQLAAAAAVQRL